MASVMERNLKSLMNQATTKQMLLSGSPYRKFDILCSLYNSTYGTSVKKKYIRETFERVYHPKKRGF